MLYDSLIQYNAIKILKFKPTPGSIIQHFLYYYNLLIPSPTHKIHQNIHPVFGLNEYVFDGKMVEKRFHFNLKYLIKLKLGNFSHFLNPCCRFLIH